MLRSCFGGDAYAPAVWMMFRLARLPSVTLRSCFGGDGPCVPLVLSGVGRRTCILSIDARLAAVDPEAELNEGRRPDDAAIAGRCTGESGPSPCREPVDEEDACDVNVECPMKPCDSVEAADDANDEVPPSEKQEEIGASVMERPAWHCTVHPLRLTCLDCDGVAPSFLDRERSRR